MARFVTLTDDQMMEAGRRAYAVAYRMLGQRADAEDVVQEVLMKTVKNQRRFRNGIANAWIYRVTVNASLDALRERGRRATLRLEAPEPAPPPADPVNLMIMLEGLTDRERSAVALVFGEGMTSAEAARVLRCLPATVRVLCHRARKKMKPQLEEWFS